MALLPQRQPDRIGPYQVLRVLGAGGMGTVYEVQHPKFPRTLALKVINARLASKNALARFWREAEYLARIRHPGVVAIHQMGTGPEGPYLVEDLVEGQVLDDLADEGVPAEAAAEIAHGVASALEAVHAAGILHRDLKPGNVVLNQDGKPVLLDFGLARDVNAEQLTRTGEIIGTPAYMSPEQARGISPADMGPEVDVYGLGAILFHLVAGRLPFESGALIEAIVQVITEEPRWPSEDDSSSVPPALEAILKVAMAKAPADRYATMREFREDLGRYLEGEACYAEERVSSVRSRRRLRRAGFVAAGGATLAALIAGLVGLWVSLGPKAIDKPTPSPDPSPAPPEPEPAFTGLWKLAPGDVFRFRTWYEETETASRTTLGVWFVARASPAEGELVRLDVTVEAARVGFGSTLLAGGGFDGSYDTREPSQSPLRAVGEAIGSSFWLSLEEDTGRVERLEGVDEIGVRVRKVIREGDGAGIPNFENLIGLSFTDAFITRIFETLLHVRGEKTILPFEERSDVKRGREFEIVQAKPAGPRVLRQLSAVYIHNTRYGFRLRGRARYADGRLEFAEASQELVGTISRRGNLTRELGTNRLTGAPEASKIVWEFRLQRPGEPPLTQYGE